MLYQGPCVLDELGHDGDHLPAELAAVMQYNAAFNDGVNTLARELLREDDLTAEQRHLIEEQTLKATKAMPT